MMTINDTPEGQSIARARISTARAYRILKIVVMSFAVALGLSACTMLRSDFEAPRLSVTGLALERLGLLEQQYRLTLRVENPNDFDLRINGLDYELFLNEQPFAHGVSGDAVSVPAFGTATLQVSVVSSLQRILQQLDQFTRRDAPALDYRLVGKIAVGGMPARLPFDYSGTVNLGTSTRKRPSEATVSRQLTASASSSAHNR